MNTLNFPAARLKAVLKNKAKKYAKLNNTTMVRLSADIAPTLDSAVTVYIENLFEKAIKITTIAKRSTMYKADLETVLGNKQYFLLSVY